jgi:hypothetical protein
MLWWALAALGAGEPEPSDHTLIYYNARMALREGESLEAIKLWLLRNALEDLTGTLSPHDTDFRSVTWAALGQAGICQDGHPTDEAGAGLWPLALHNWVVRNMGRRKPASRPNPFDAFQLGQQQRFVSLGDVLGAEELRNVHLFRGRCLRARVALVSAGEAVNADLSDRQVAARLMRYLLVRARTTLGDDVRGRAALEARLFDVDLQLTALAAQEARREARTRARRGREIGMSRESVTSMTEQAPDYTFSEDSEPAAILRASVSWPPSEWMALSAERRLFLFDHARRFGGDTAALDAIALGVIDALIARGEGEQVHLWIPRVSGGEAPDTIWGGDRGQRLLALDREMGFQERSVIALHRGVHALQQGDLPGALRLLAYALQFAPESQEAETVQSLSRRWMSYVASQFAITDDLLVTLQELVPRRDYSVVLEDLMWRAAFHADRASFARGVDNQLGGDALERRIALLEPLAEGDVARFSALVRDGLAQSPSETLRFLDQMVQRLELEDAEVRASHVPTLASVRRLLAPLATDTGTSGGRGRTAAALVQRAQAILEGVGGLGPGATARDSARSLAPGSEVFAGSVRLAPSDPLPWPFRASEVSAPSIFTPLDLTPEEWRGESGEWVFGWSLGG